MGMITLEDFIHRDKFISLFFCFCFFFSSQNTGSFDLIWTYVHGCINLLNFTSFQLKDEEDLTSMTE